LVDLQYRHIAGSSEADGKAEEKIDAMNTLEQVALLTDQEAESCLNGLLKGLSITDPTFKRLLRSPTDIQDAVRLVSADLGTEISQTDEPSTDQRPKVIRTVLVQIAKNPTLSPRLGNWLKTARPKLLEPVTTSLVLAGIVFVLSTDVKVEYANVAGKKKLKVKVEKKATASKLLEKFFALF
jgi:hypothetical protein